jgi:peptidoglycan hydrolase-like protein with peptidoglycan-binding domain
MARRPVLMFGFAALAVAWLGTAHAQSTQVPLAFVQPLSPAAVMQVQERLKQNGVYAGAVDGVWGTDSQTALERFQQGRGLSATASINQATATLLGLSPTALLAPSADPVPTAGEPLNAAAIRNVQQQLRVRGFYRGSADGIWGPGTQDAVMRFQQGQGLQATGQINPATAQALGLDASNLQAPARSRPTR